MSDQNLHVESMELATAVCADEDEDPFGHGVDFDDAQNEERPQELDPQGETMYPQVQQLIIRECQRAWLCLNLYIPCYVLFSLEGQWRETQIDRSSSVCSLYSYTSPCHQGF